MLWALLDTLFFSTPLIFLVTNPHPGICVRCDRTSVHMHHKFAVVDERLLITGSLNWTQTAVQRNKENILITEEPDLVQPFVKEFQRLWLNNDPAQKQKQWLNIIFSKTESLWCFTVRLTGPIWPQNRIDVHIKNLS